MGRTETAIVAVAAGFLAVVLLASRAGRPAADLPRPAPDFDLPQLDGARFRLSTARGRPWLVNFWATWCPPCVEEVPSLEALARRHGTDGSGLGVVAVSVDADPEAVRRFVTGHGVTYRVLLDPEATTAHRYGTFKFPESYLVDREGWIVRKYVGALEWTSPEVLAEIEALLGRGAESQRGEDGT